MKIMKLLIAHLSLFFAITALVPFSAAQTPSQPHMPNNPLPQWVVDNARKRGEFESRTRSPAPANPTVVTRRRLPRRTEADGPTAAETADMLRPPQPYLDTYEDFLKDSDHGILRLFPDRGCDKGITVTVESLEKCGSAIPVRGAGSLFSFRLRTNYSRIPDFWDIHFSDGIVSGGNDTVQVIFAETDLTDLTLIKGNHPSLKAISRYEPKSTKSEIEQQGVELRKGIMLDGVRLSNELQPNSDKVFAARVIAYFDKPPNGFRYGSRFDGKGLDIKLAFQIVGREDDGSLIIIWSELQRDLPRKKISN